MYNQRRKKSVIRLEMDETTLTGSRLSKLDTDMSMKSDRIGL